MDSQFRPSLPITLKTLQFLRTTRNINDTKVFDYLDASLDELNSHGCAYVLPRLLIHIGDISRQHNIFKKLGIESKTGGGQSRKIFRSIVRWWSDRMPESFIRNIPFIVEYTVLENLMHYQITTSRLTGEIYDIEITYPIHKEVHKFLKGRIHKNENIELIARHLPKYETGRYRTSKIVIDTRDDTYHEYETPENKKWVKLNGKIITDKKYKAKTGDILSYPRPKSEEVLQKQSYVNNWIKGFCAEMEWSIKDYNEFRKKQNTPEQILSNGVIYDLNKEDTFNLLDNATAGQRMRLNKILTNRTKYPKHSKWLEEWESNQATIAQDIRNAMANNDTTEVERLSKDFKVKATGKNTVDLLVDMFSNKYTDDMINNTYQAMIDKMDISTSVFPIVDGSGSMSMRVPGTNVANRDVAYAMAIAFSTRNPNEEFRNTLGWFSEDFKVMGTSKYNGYPTQKYAVGPGSIPPTDDLISSEYTFIENLDRIKKADCREYAQTNISAAIEYFVELVLHYKCKVEDLPGTLLFITDNEHNKGKHPGIALKDAMYTIGWEPLVVYWGITELDAVMYEHYSTIPNCLLIGGFNETVLSQVIKGIKTGKFNPEDEIWSIVENKRYSLIR